MLKWKESPGRGYLVCCGNYQLEVLHNPINITWYAKISRGIKLEAADGFKSAKAAKRWCREWLENECEDMCKVLDWRISIWKRRS